MRTGVVVVCCLALLAVRSTLAVNAAIERAVGSPARSTLFMARDAGRHPGEAASGIRVTPASAVVEIWPRPAVLALGYTAVRRRPFMRPALPAGRCPAWIRPPVEG